MIHIYDGYYHLQSFSYFLKSFHYTMKVYGNYHIWIIWLWIKKYFMNNQFHAFLEDSMYSNIKYHSFCNLVYKKGSGKQFQIYNKHWHFWISIQVQSQLNICQGGKKDNHKRLLSLQIFWKCSYHHSSIHRTYTCPVKMAWHFRIKLE